MRRTERVADTIREEIAQIVGYELEDPRLTMVTVTDVRLSVTNVTPKSMSPSPATKMNTSPRSQL
jgi:Ribosome-binding factor A